MQSLLIVEDDNNLRTLYSQEFMEDGYQVYPASNSREALDILAQSHPDLAILDLVMPGADGIELLQRFVKHTPPLPVVINTAYPVYRHNYLTWSAEAYVIKSSDLSELKNTVKAVLQNQQKDSGQNVS